MIRITTSEVCALGRFSRATLWRRVKDGSLPAAVDQSREAIFDRDRVIAALATPRPRWRARPVIASPSATMTGAVSGGATVPRQSPRRWSEKRWALA